MATFSLLQERVSRRVIDLPASILAEVPSLVTQAIFKLQQKHNFKVMDYVPAALTTTVGTRTLGAIPTDRKELWNKPYILNEDGYVCKLAFAPNVQSLLPVIGPSDTGKPRVLRDGNLGDTGSGSYEVWPLPDALSDYDDGNYRIVVPYRRFLPTLSADADTNWFSVNAEDWIVFRATSDAFFLDWDEERGAAFRQLAQNEYDDVIRADKIARVAGVTTLVPHFGADDAMIDE